MSTTPGIILNPDALNVGTLQGTTMRRTSDPVISGINSQIEQLNKELQEVYSFNKEVKKQIKELKTKMANVIKENTKLSNRIAQFEPGEVKRNLKLKRTNR